MTRQHTTLNIGRVFAKIILFILTPRLGAIASRVKGLVLFGSIEDLFFNLMKCNNWLFPICKRFSFLPKNSAHQAPAFGNGLTYHMEGPLADLNHPSEHTHVLSVV